MTKTRDLSDLLDANGDVKSTALDNVPASNDASALTTGTLPDARLSTNVTQNSSTQTLTNKTIDASSNTLSNIPNSALANSSITINGTATELGGSISVATTDASSLTTGTLDNARLPSSIDISGTLTADGISLGDNETINVGASNDLQIYHDGTHSYIHDAGTGHLKLRATNFRVTNSADTETLIQADDNGDVQLYYNNSVKLATTSAGATVTGTLSATSFSGSGSGITGVSNTASVWVNFNGTGTVAIRDDYNVSTITDNDTGLYTINFSTALADNDYACAGMACDSPSSGGTMDVSFWSPYYQSIDTTIQSNKCKINTVNSDNNGQDPQACTFIAFR